jgi:DNA-binding response OmpR family regulator
MLFDVNMPEIDGFNLAKVIRMTSNVQIIFITSLSDEESVVKGLGLGNCDYLRKPFGLKELQLRIVRAFQLIDAVGGPPQVESEYYFPDKCCIKKGERLITLTKNENKLLKVLFDNENKICPVDEIIIKIWGDHNIDNMNNLDVLLHKTRKKLEGTPLSIENIRGIGYSIVTLK